MLTRKNRSYIKREPFKEGKLFVILCEGEKRETRYFRFFNELTSQVIIEIVRIEDGRNSPLGLYENACIKIFGDDEKSIKPKHFLADGDEVWFVVDTDKWEHDLTDLRNQLSKHNNWFVAQSNPCFELWLYYHFEKEKPANDIPNWKLFLDTVKPGGFDPRKHPMYVQDAIQNSVSNFSTTAEQPDHFSTEVHLLAQKILPLVKESIDKLLVDRRG